MRDRLSSCSTLVCGGFFAALLLMAWFAYLPGLQGSFLFDDFVNLNALGAYGPVDNWTTFWRYITSGSADPTGRPLALLTFLLDANNWPADPYPFKRTNVVLHLANGTLLFLLLWRWGSLLAVSRVQAGMAAAFGAGVWMLHPLLVSTTLYVVQREAMLPATFVLLGLIGYTEGYLLSCRERRLGAAVATFSVVSCTALAVMSKANGALLPAFVYLVDRLVLMCYRKLPERSEVDFHILRWGVIYIPTAVLVIYLSSVLWAGFVNGTPPHRPWAMSERLLTEARIFFDYLRLLWLPQPYSGGLFNDGYIISKNIFQPLSTLVSVVMIFGLIVAALVWRIKYWAWALAFLFFAIGHLMETGVLLLELYYEHRNYLPAMLMFWPLGLVLAKAAGKLGERSILPGVSLTLLVAVPLLLGAMTWARASIWGDPQAQAYSWAELSPGSPRAQAYAAQMELDSNNPAAAIIRLEALLEKKPDEIQLALNLLGAKCQHGRIQHSDIDSAEYALRTTTVMQRIGYEWFEEAIPVALSGGCEGLNGDVVDRLIDAARSNPRVQKVPGRMQDLESVSALLAIGQGDPEGALEHFNRAFDFQPRPGVALAQAAKLAKVGYYSQALAHLEYSKESQVSVRLSEARDMAGFHRWLLQRQGYWETEAAILGCKIAMDGGLSDGRACAERSLD